MTNVVSVKQQMTHIIQDQPDDSSFEEILKELAFALMVDRGLEDSRAGRTISHDEMKRRVASCGISNADITHEESQVNASLNRQSRRREVESHTLGLGIAL